MPSTADRDGLLRWASPMLWVRLVGKAFARSWGRDVMLYTGGVSFFALLAVFPAIAILIGFYKAVLSISQVSEQAAALADLLPHAAQGIFKAEIERLANVGARTVSAQSLFALVIGAYAAHRGFKALLAGLNLIHDDAAPHGFVKFNLLAFFVALFAFALFTVVSGAVVTSRLLERTAEALKAYTIPHVFPCHCTGDAACAYLAERLGSSVQPGYAGMKMTF